MKEFVDLFNEAMDLACLGVFEKKQLLESRGEYYSKILKKALDKFALLNFKYAYENSESEQILPNDETALIKMFSNDINDIIDNLPEVASKLLQKTDWYYEQSLVHIGSGNSYYCSENLLDSINYTRKFRKANEAKYKELELASYYFIEKLFERNQDEYCEIRNFLEQREHAFITDTMYRKNDYIKEFKKKYEEIFDAAYEGINYIPENVKVCKHCGLVLKELTDGTLYCISERCKKESKGFSEYDIKEINDQVLVLRENVARFIYYPGILEQEIKNILNKHNIEINMWTMKDTWDFEFEYKDKKWAIDAKDIKNPIHIIKDITKKEKENDDYDIVIYVVPSDKKKAYLNAINNSILNKQKYRCITFAEFKRIFQ